MFYALAHEKIDMRGFKVEHVIEDIESLNQRALKGELEVTAVSCHAFAYLSEKYAVMRSGASVGDGYGPVLVRSCEFGVWRKAENTLLRVAVPGELTTAFLALQLYANPETGFANSELPAPYQVVFTPFDKIFAAVKSGEVDYGLVIHEGQLTHAAEGFEKVLDLGEWWHETTKLPLPLGIDIIRKDLGAETMKRFAVLFRVQEIIC